MTETFNGPARRGDPWRTCDPATPTWEKLLESLAFAERSRLAARGRATDVSQRERDALRRIEFLAHRRVPSGLELDVRAENAVSRDQMWRAAVTDEQWGCRLAVTYGVAELVAQVTAMTHLLNQVVMLLRRATPDTVVDGPPQD